MLYSYDLNESTNSKLLAKFEYYSELDIKSHDFFLYDLIILDIMMPNISGIDFLRDFRIKDKNTPVLMLTANNQITKKGDSYDSGCDDYLIKPFEPDELLMRLKTVIFW